MAGIAAGVAVGLPYGLMVLLEGIMAGLMGGTMGAMMGGMMPGRATPLTVASLLLTGQQDHDLSIPDLPYRRSDRADLRAEPLGFHLFAGPGEDAAMDFVALREGEYKAYCSVPGHREAGMQVLLRVTDSK